MVRALQRKLLFHILYCSHQNDFIKLCFPFCFYFFKIQKSVVAVGFQTLCSGTYHNYQYLCHTYPLSLFLSSGCRLLNPYLKAYFIRNHQKCVYETIYLWVNTQLLYSCLFLEYRVKCISDIKELQGFYLNCRSAVVEDFTVPTSCLPLFFLVNRILIFVAGQPLSWCGIG